MTTSPPEDASRTDLVSAPADGAPPGGWPNPRRGFLFFLGLASIGAGMANLVPAALPGHRPVHRAAGGAEPRRDDPAAGRDRGRGRGAVRAAPARPAARRGRAAGVGLVRVPPHVLGEPPARPELRVGLVEPAAAVPRRRRDPGLPGLLP